MTIRGYCNRVRKNLKIMKLKTKVSFVATAYWYLCPHHDWKYLKYGNLIFFIARESVYWFLIIISIPLIYYLYNLKDLEMTAYWVGLYIIMIILYLILNYCCRLSVKMNQSFAKRILEHQIFMENL